MTTSNSEPLSTETHLDPALKAKWLEALRSGHYKQGQKCLRTDDNCYCCLGVLADLIDPTRWSRPEAKDWHWQAEFYPPESEDESGCWNSDRTEYLPKDVAEELDLPTEVQQTLGMLNDGTEPNQWQPQIPKVLPKSFDEIANWIETNL